MTNIAKIGIWLDPDPSERRWRYGQNVFELYLEEVLAHAGLPFQRLESQESLQAFKPDVLLVALSDERDSSIQQLQDYVRKGGTLISYAGLNRMAGSLGCTETVSKEAVYAELPTTGTAADGYPLRALGAKSWHASAGADSAAANAKAVGSLRSGSADGPVTGAAYLEFALGEGKLIRWNVNIPETIVMLQQGGGPVYEDGIPAPDGSGNLDEGILKADDRCELDWTLDRRTTSTGMAYYAVPYADLWRELLIEQIIREAADRGLAVPFIDYWPDGIEQVAMISHDSDLNIDESALVTLDVLKESGVTSTWCMIEPGYSSEVYDRVKAEGHELAFHYNALEKENGVWSKEEFDRQLAFIQSTTGEEIVSNKNHYTRYEGWGELFEWCEAAGIESDQTRGPSKKGNIGFPFGTCHPYYPVAWADERNRRYAVLEIGFLTQDLEHSSLADLSVVAPFLEQVGRVRGVAHFLFHQTHILQQPKVRDAIREVIRLAKEQGFVFWTGKQIARWEQSRRAARIGTDSMGRPVLEQLPAGGVLRISVPRQDGRQAQGAVKRFGFPCVKWTPESARTDQAPAAACVKTKR
ncbi:polysaccharide deacetylase family protein [Paenibacillus puerhi]|uniref:hypothetical protein n=1 Tax=Paenibacillus puerhi TaxID=2692622 RepID=UPI0019167C43|nr:hypothetical protein [Paenibacillus puerhi]